jgi:hypothetical protein
VNHRKALKVSKERKMLTKHGGFGRLSLSALLVGIIPAILFPNRDWRGSSSCRLYLRWHRQTADGTFPQFHFAAVDVHFRAYPMIEVQFAYNFATVEVVFDSRLPDLCSKCLIWEIVVQ